MATPTRACPHWLHAPRTSHGVVFAAFLVHGLCLRVVSVDAVLGKWANTHQRNVMVALAGLVLGAMQDACVAVVLCLCCWLPVRLWQSVRLQPLTADGVEDPPVRRDDAAAQVPPHAASSSLPSLQRPRRRPPPPPRPGPLALMVAIQFVLINAIFCVDLVFLRTRQMRFQWDFVLLYWRELHREGDAVAQFQVDEAEWFIACQMAGATLLAALLLGLSLDDRLKWLRSPLSEWDQQLWRICSATCVAICSHVRTANGSSTREESPPHAAVVARLPKPDEDDRHHDHSSDDTALLPSSSTSHRSPGGSSHSSDGLFWRLARMLLLWFALLASTVAMAKCVPSAVAMIAWNASLCEPLRVLAGVECIHTRSLHIDKQLRELIDTTTERCVFITDDNNRGSPSDTLVRKTLGFHGPLAFDVTVKPDEKPNVLVVVVESFRQRDSRYLLNPQHAAEFLPANVSLTPHFDQWTKRGIGFRSMWSSWRTSRSLEQILFGQLPLDSATDSGTSYGRSHVRLSGMPQLLKAKDYETLFTTGSRLDYDEWDVFLSTHGFDKCLTGWDLADIGMDELGIDWTEGDRMMAYWGFHDDLSFQVLAHILKSKQDAKMSGKDGKPWFATHYTISSHVPFDERPDWYYRLRENGHLPDFSPLYQSIDDPEIQELVKNYAEMRFFSDLSFGMFMDNLERSGVLEDTIVIVTGDHGHGPERGVAMPEEDQVGAMNVAAALIAEGRLGKYAGTIVEDVVAHYDLLNTVADIVGVPLDEGFLQTGVGRSLKRLPVDDQRVVYSHNPALNLAAVQGHTRIEFFADVPDVMRVYNIERDPRRENDLLSELPKARRREIEQICDEGRALNDYFTQRWHADCLLPPFCTNSDAIPKTS